MLTDWRSVLFSSAMLTVESAARKRGRRATRSPGPAENVFDRTGEGKQFGIRAAAREQLQSHRQGSGEVLDRQGDAAEPEQVSRTREAQRFFTPRACGRGIFMARDRRCNARRRGGDERI